MQGVTDKVEVLGKLVDAVDSFGESILEISNTFSVNNLHQPLVIANVWIRLCKRRYIILAGF
jgi:hypothetical protein